MIENYSKTKSLLYKLLGQVANKRINNKTVFFETSLIIKLWLEKTTLAHRTKAFRRHNEFFISRSLFLCKQIFSLKLH